MSDFTVEIERETDGRWIGEVTDLPGVLAYGATRDEAVAKAKALAFRVLADRLEHGEEIPEIQCKFKIHAPPSNYRAGRAGIHDASPTMPCVRFSASIVTPRKARHISSVVASPHETGFGGKLGLRKLFVELS